MNLGKRTGVALAIALLTAAAGCSTRAPETTGGGGGGGGDGEVETGVGVTEDTITLGVLTDLTGVFAALGNDITNAHVLYWDQVNEDGGVCDRQIELDVKDTGYVPQQGVQLYAGMKESVLAMQQTIGSPINTALEGQYTADQIVNLPSAWARGLTNPPGSIVPGATYDIESLNVLSYAMNSGLIKEGDTIGHIYFTGEYGENGLAGSEYFTEEHGMELVPAEIRATDADMSAQITQFRSAGVDAIMLTTAPTQTASAATVSATQGLDVPILGNNPVFAPGLLTGPAKQELIDRLVFASPVSTFNTHKDLLAQYRERFNVEEPSAGVLTGYAMADIMNQVLEAACDNGALTREGMLEAKQALEDVQPMLNDEPLLVPLDLTVEPGESPSGQSFILQPAEVPGGVQRVEDQQEPFESEDVEGFTPAA